MLHKYYHWLLRHVDYFVFLLFFSLHFSWSCCLCPVVFDTAANSFFTQLASSIVFDPTIQLFLTQHDHTSGKLPICPTVLTQLSYGFWPNHPVIFDPTGLHKWKAAEWWAFLSCFDTVVLLFLTQPSNYFWPNRTAQVERCSLVNLCPTVLT